MALTATERVDLALSAFFKGRPATGRLRVALSGGRDSVVLLHALHRLQAAGGESFALSAIHVHHGISVNADAWAEFCGDLCDGLGISLEIVRVSVPRDSGEGLEAAARRLRHQAFASCAADCLALAQHRDDQAETVLLNLLRGAGVAGAAAMPAVRAARRGPCLLRPLLDVPRAVIEGYAVEQGVRWIEDESNEDRHYRRNFLRHEILPALESKFPGARQALARAAGHFAEAGQLLDELAAADELLVRLPSGRLCLDAFNRLAPARARNLLRYAWRAAGFRAPDTRWIEEALRQLAVSDAQSATCVASPEGELHVYRGEVYLLPQRPAVPDVPLPWHGEPLLWWAGDRLRFEDAAVGGIRRELMVAEAIEIRPRQGGERFKPHARRPRRSLRNLLQEVAMPPWERERLPLLWIGGRLAWVGGLGVDADFACAPGDSGILPVWVPSAGGDASAQY